MKRQLCTFVLSGMLATGVLLAQEPGSAPEQSAPAQGQMGNGEMAGMHHGPRMDASERLTRMTKRYQLSSEQQSQLKPILEDEQQQMMAMRSDSSTSRDDKRAKMQSLHQGRQQKIEAILTEPQRQKFEADQQKMQARRAEKMRGGSAAAAPDGGQPPQ